MHILVTNDDGIQSPGLLALAEEMLQLGKVTVMAPDHNWSACGHVKTLERPLRVREVALLPGATALQTDGAPSDCVALAALGLVTEKIDLLVSGINPHANLGQDLTYSGTVTAAMEGAIHGIPSLAVSLDADVAFADPQEYRTAARAARKIALRVAENGLPPFTLLNVNVPLLPEEELKGTAITRQGLRVYRDKLVVRHDPRQRPYYWIGGEAPTGIPDDGTDIGALAQGCISITPIHLDMTAYRTLEVLKSWQWG
jgi:5'-nucleotidase